MTTYHETRLVAAPVERLFDLVADVESYPRFLPLWRHARILRRNADSYVTDQEVGLGPIRERFQTKTVLARPERIDVTSFDPLFSAFSIRWQFEAHGMQTRVAIALSWKMQSRGLQRGIDMLLPSAARSMVSAFEKRACSGTPRHLPEILLPHPHPPVAAPG